MHKLTVALNMSKTHTITVDESQRQAVLLALAHLAVERPGWNAMLTEIAAKMDNMKPNGDLQMFSVFKETCDRKAQADKVNTPLAAGVCMDLPTQVSMILDQAQKNIRRLRPLEKINKTKL